MNKMIAWSRRVNWHGRMWLTLFLLLPVCFFIEAVLAGRAQSDFEKVTRVLLLMMPCMLGAFYVARQTVQRWSQWDELLWNNDEMRAQ